MTGLDTNVLVRCLTPGDPVQARRASALVEAGVAAGEKLLVNHVVLCEFAWVLESAYGYSRAEVAGIPDRVLRTAQFAIPDKDVAWHAWSDYGSQKGDFADCLIGYGNEHRGAAVTATFDQALKGHKRFRIL